MLDQFKKLLIKKKKQLKAHIDSSIFIELIFNQPRAQRCQILLRTAGMKNKPLLKVSSTVLGEVVKIIDREEDDLKRKAAYDYLNGILSRRSILVHTPGKKALLENIPKIYETDSFIESMDLLNVASAVEDNARIYYAYDSRLNRCREIEKKFNIKFKEP